MTEKINTVAEIIAKASLSQVVYMVEHDGRKDFIYFSTENINDEEICDIQNSASELLNCDVGIVDIKDFSEFDRVNVIKKSKIVYCENPMLPKIVEYKAIEHFNNVKTEKINMLKRKQEYGSFYLQ